MKKFLSPKGVKGTGAKVAVMLLALSLVMCSIIGGTVAWLVDKTASVENTFTYGDISIGLTETTGSTYKMMPGNTITKDPKVTVKANSEACWLFVKIDQSATFDSFMTYEVADRWTLLEKDNEGNDIKDQLVYYCQVDALTDDTDFGILKNDQVQVLNTVTKQDFHALTAYPTLTFTAYAVQRDAVVASPEYAWSLTK